MFTPPGYRKRLLADLARWTEAGLISRDAAGAIADEYKTDSSRAILTVLAFVFAILAAGGLIALVAANWNVIPREVRVVGLFAVNLLALGVCLAFCLSRKPGSLAIETSAALTVFAAAASISLMGQIYHLPSNYPGFGLAMMCIAGATALVARSTACLWLAAVAQYGYHVATVIDEPRVVSHVGGSVSLMPWTAQHWIFLGASVLLIGLAISRWTARSGPWTIFIAVLPLFWWIDDIEAVPALLGRALAWTACGIVVASILARELRAADRFDAAASALIGIFAIGVAVLSTQSFTSNTLYQGAGLTVWYSLLAIVAAIALAAAAAVRRYADRASLWWLAAALAIPFAANRVLPGSASDLPTLDGIVRLVLVVLLPLGLLAIEARLSERRKTFAFAIAAVILIVISEVWATNDLVTLAFVLLGGSVLLGGAILLTRFLSARRAAPAGGGDI
jgi:uncharacterized membrane protein